MVICFSYINAITDALIRNHKILEAKANCEFFEAFKILSI